MAHLNLFQLSEFPQFSQFYEKIQKTCLPGVWSKGVALNRFQSVVLDSIRSGEEIVFKVKSADHLVSRKVSLWPGEDNSDWYCDCDDRNDVCPHVAAAVIALKTSSQNPGAVETKKPSLAQIHYRFKRHEDDLLFERWLVLEGKPEKLLTETLVSFMGGVQSGRVQFSPILATQQDYAIDYIVGSKSTGRMDYSILSKLIPVLSETSHVELDRATITVSSKKLKYESEVIREGEGFRIRIIKDPSVTETFKNGLALCSQTLRMFEIPQLNPFEKELLSGAGTYFARNKVAHFIVEVLPALEKKIGVDQEKAQLPQVKKVLPRIVLETEASPDAETLLITPRIVYGDSLAQKNMQEIIIEDTHAEKNILRKLQSELQLNPGQRVQFHGESAVYFALRLKGWETAGEGIAKFTVKGSLNPVIRTDQNSFDITFQADQSSGLHLDTSQSSDSSSQLLADSNRVIQAWRENQNFVPLLDGGWAHLPKNWLATHGDRVSALLAAKGDMEKLPAYFMPEIIQLCEELNQDYSENLKKLKQHLQEIKHLPEAKLPDDLKATLRNYQHQGVNWLCFLRDQKMGAMLADDMGLGKTLQALCAIPNDAKTLIVVPTSVLHAWGDQIQQFRPHLKYSIYYGNDRSMEGAENVILTTYALLRLDQEILLKQEWDMVILDEAQVIKNPSSQVTKAAYRLRALFKLTLSGTPVENRLEDLWSQFQFLNPGIFGTLEDFKENFVTPISLGDEAAAQRLRSRTKPFILRRMKRDVVTELPPRTETVLYCQLDEQEKTVYESILLASKKDALEKLETGGNVLAVLEVLLRLRQACCHIGLIPGQKSDRSSKLELLIQTLENSIAGGHRALVFSQWTSYLDLIEPYLEKNQFSFSRLDGSTQNREQIVKEFQDPAGPKVMLISLKAGGTGLTLTAADHIFIMDPWWNPAVEDQAASRADRIGQLNPVLVHRLVAESTIEEKILQLQKSKLDLASAVFENGMPAAALTRDDLLALLGG